MDMNSENLKCGDTMQKTDKDGTLTKEYIDFVKGLEREDLERFYMGADLYNYDISNDNERLHNIINNAIEFIEEHNIIGTNKEYLPNEIEKCYSLELMEILKGEDKK